MAVNEHENPLIQRSQEDDEREPQSPAVIGVTRKEDDPSQPAIPDVIPILPLRNMVVFPGTVIPLTVGRASSRKLLEESARRISQSLGWVR